MNMRTEDEVRYKTKSRGGKVDQTVEFTPLYAEVPELIEMILDTLNHAEAWEGRCTAGERSEILKRRGELAIAVSNLNYLRHNLCRSQNLKMRPEQFKVKPTRTKGV